MNWDHTTPTAPAPWATATLRRCFSPT